jgi:hypothetical protein
MERVMTHSATRVVPILLCAAFAAPAAAQRGMGGHAGHAIAVAPPPRVGPQLSLPRAAPQISAPHVVPRVMAPQISAPRVVPQIAAPQVAPRVSPNIGTQQFAQPSTPGVVQRAPRAFAAPVERAQQFTSRRPEAGTSAPAPHGIPALQHHSGTPGIQERTFSGPSQLSQAPRVSASLSNRVLRNPAFARHATAANLQLRALAHTTFQGRFNARFAEWGRHHHHRHFVAPVVIGFVGPLFWPYAEDDFFNYTYYPYAYDSFWPYAYGDLYDEMLGGYAYGVGTAYAAVGPAQANRAPLPAAASDPCNGDASGLKNWPISTIAQTIGPDAAQRALLEDLKNATAQALAALRASCPADLPSTPTGRIEAMRVRTSAMLAAVHLVRPAFAAFYDSLNDEQKARFNALGFGDQEEAQTRNELAQICADRSFHAAGVPMERIERAVRPNDAQRAAFNELQDATARATDLLKSDCPSYRPLTPVARLDTIEQRLDAVLRAVTAVQPALQKFYATLSDEQKERFNRLS